MKEPGKCQAPSMFNEKFNEKFNDKLDEKLDEKNPIEPIEISPSNSAGAKIVRDSGVTETVSRNDFPRIKVGVLLSPRADGLFVGTFDDALIIDLPGARAALALCDGSKSISAIAISVGISESDLIELISTLNHAALITFEKVTNQKLLPELQLIDWYPQSATQSATQSTTQSTTSCRPERMKKRIATTIYISKLNRIGFALSGTLLASGIGAVISDDNRKITMSDLIGGYLRLSDVGRSRNEVLADQSRENSQSKNSSDLRDPTLLIATTPPDPELLAEWMRGSTPFFLIDGLDRDNLTFGPFVTPGKDACPRCIDLHCLDRDPNWNSVSLAHFLDRRRELSTPLALLGASIGAIFALAQVDQLDQLDQVSQVDSVDQTGQETPSQISSQFQSQFQLRGKTITYSGSELMHPVIRRWSRHPLCGCSWQ